MRWTSSSGVETNGTDEKIPLVNHPKQRTAPATYRNKGDSNKDEQKDATGYTGASISPETLMNEIIQLEEAYEHYKKDPDFNAELNDPAERITQAGLPYYTTQKR